VTTLHRSLSHTDLFPQSCCLIAGFKGGRSSASGLTSLHGGDHLMPTSYCDHWLQPGLPLLLAPQLGWLPTVNLQLLLSILDWLKLFQDPLTCPQYRPHRKHHFQKFLHCCMHTLLSNSSGIIACIISCFQESWEWKDDHRVLIIWNQKQHYIEQSS
jgi:hypothetical protein